MLIDKADDQRARALLEDALTRDPTYGPAVNNLGVIEFRAGRLYEAAWQFESAIKLMPRQAEPANNLGLVLEEAGKFEDAERQFNTASTLDRFTVPYAANRARVRVRQGKIDAATLELLDYVRTYDARPEWREWARDVLLRSRVEPTTRPSQ